MDRQITSASSSQAEQVLTVLLLCSFFGYGGAALADETEVPDLEFLEYLGSWDDSDEDWVLFASEDDVQEGQGDEDGKPAPQGEKVAELEDEE
ncbi:MAG: hypothetical protein ACR2Q3_02620 [Woeseiaceae bacterium]